MSAELYTASGPGGNILQGTTVGGSKPLHRFIKGQPKITGIIVLVLGVSFFVISIAVTGENAYHPAWIWTAIPPGFLQGTLFIICGILYIVTEHNPTKKTVTVSLALSIVTILGTCWTILHILPELGHSYYYRYYEFIEENMTEIDDAAWSSHYEAMGVTIEAIFVFYSFVGGIIFIVMSTLAGAALRSTKSQAIVVMTTMAAETPVE
ncbi:uncharacterized protein AKAME5_001042500 [Lates japonicus]|uniref:Uncharacterized protein n=1 Tax=Lates japonicus TaxID=270547 RepID=A0AAD3R7C5_LATJO|nr:uncharacterized protein AKAME5_001042500 [Lates japonicus]